MRWLTQDKICESLLQVFAFFCPGRIISHYSFLAEIPHDLMKYWEKLIWLDVFNLFTPTMRYAVSIPNWQTKSGEIWQIKWSTKDVAACPCAARWPTKATGVTPWQSPRPDTGSADRFLWAALSGLSLLVMARVRVPPLLLLDILLLLILLILNLRNLHKIIMIK